MSKCKSVFPSFFLSTSCVPRTKKIFRKKKRKKIFPTKKKFSALTDYNTSGHPTPSMLWKNTFVTWKSRTRDKGKKTQVAFLGISRKGTTVIKVQILFGTVQKDREYFQFYLIIISWPFIVLYTKTQVLWHFHF
jgi:hypothetical protein